MSISRRIATGFAATMLATSGLVAAGAGIGAAPAAAAPAGHHHCPSHKGKYPPGKCKIYFSHHKVHRHHSVALSSGRVFKPGEKVTVELICPKTKHHKKFVRHEASRHAHHSGSVLDSFKLPKKTPVGRCEIVLHGKKSGVTLTGTVHVKK